MDVELQEMFLVAAVAGAETTIYPREASDADALKLYSDADGEFSGGDAVSSQSAVHVLRTTKSGYKDLVIEIGETESSYAIVVLLVREDT
jgi:hypothetical protein